MVSTESKAPKKGTDVFQLRKSFEPALNKSGHGRLTYMGYEHSATKDGERGFMNLVFSCKAKAGDAVLLSIPVSYTISLENKFGKLLTLLGCDIKDSETVEDEDGFEVESEDTDYSYVYDFLDTKIGSVFTAKLPLVDDKPGLYRIDIDTLKPLTGKDGKQRVDDITA